MAKEKKEGLVKDLAEKVKRGELKPEGAKKEVLRRRLRYVQYKRGSYKFKYHLISPLLAILGTALCVLPFIAKQTGWGELSSFAQLPSIDFPLIVKISMFAFFIILFGVGRYTSHLRKKKGGTSDRRETVIFIRGGPYKVMRHPEEISFALILLLVTIGLSGGIPFTVLSIIGNVLFLTGFYYDAKGEEELNLLKWGNAYRRYQREVPMFNFILGAWRLAGGKERQKSGKFVKDSS
jgi:protein-S-isoprenylcysteine O-methyltransferase Ste14